MTSHSKYSLPVSEQFLSLQGEGPTTGVPSYFLRLKSCNLLCGGKGTDKDGELHNGATWRCDTVEVWLKGKQKGFDQIILDYGIDFVENIRNHHHHLILTGGEPLLHDSKLNDFLAYVYATDQRAGYVEVETNGTLLPSQKLASKVSQWNVSPKLANSGMPASKRIKELPLNFFATNSGAIFKFVVSNKSDITEVINDFVDPFGIKKERVFLMPAADNKKSLEASLPGLAEDCIKYGFRLSTRLHVGIWDKKTGV